MSKNYFFVFFASLLVAGFIFMALPDKSFSQAPQGCCQSANNGTCIQGQQQDMNGCLAAQGVFFPNVDICSGGPTTPACGPAGCCVFDPGDCETQPPASCDVEDLVENTSCDDIDKCAPVTGCCETEDENEVFECFDGDTEKECRARPNTEDWKADTPCNGVTCSDEGPVGCCFCDADDACFSGGQLTSEECERHCDAPFDWEQGQECNVEGTCGQLGCCQFEAPNPGPECKELNLDDCKEDGGEWNPDDSCTDSGLCASNIFGCCVFHKNDCDFILQQECDMEGGKFTEENLQCSEVPICNIVISPIPTLNQWGLIAMAGLLGLFGLFIIIRRHRYNLS